MLRTPYLSAAAAAVAAALLRRITIGAASAASPLRHHSTKQPSLPTLTIIPSKYRTYAIRQAQEALTEYLHTTRSLPFIYADLISKHSTFSLYNLISSLSSVSSSTLLKSVQKHLLYHPINEFEFFFESIGIEYGNVKNYLSNKKFFFSEDGKVFDAACLLAGFGFPWNKLGVLYKYDASIFSMRVQELESRLSEVKNFIGFGNVVVVGVCLAFPGILRHGVEGPDGLALRDVKKVAEEFDFRNAEGWYEVCRKMRVFYELGCEKGKMGELMVKGKSVFVEYMEKELLRKVQYFCKFDVRKESIGMLILERPEILSLELESRDISVIGLLKHLGMKGEKLKCVCKTYPYVLGRNKMANLPYVMRAMNLNEWFFDTIKNGNHKLLASYALSDPDEGVDKKFRASLEKIQCARTVVHSMRKLDFLRGIGFGENALTVKVLTHLHGTSTELEERFDCLVRLGMEYSRICAMVYSTPKILNQKPETLEQKVNFFCKEVGMPLHSLDVFPASLCYDLESRIKPRYRFHKWLAEKGWSSKNYTIASIVATSEKNFINRLRGIHPDAPKLWHEQYKYKEPIDNCQGDS